MDLAEDCLGMVTIPLGGAWGRCNGAREKPQPEVVTAIGWDDNQPTVKGGYAAEVLKDLNLPFG